MAGAERTMADSLNRYLDRLVGADTSLLPRRPVPVDPELAHAAQTLHTRDHVPGADPAFVERLLSDILADSGHGTAQFTTWELSRVRATAAPASWGTGWNLAGARRWPLDHWAIGHLATAALLVLTVAASLLFFGPVRDRAFQEDAGVAITGFPGSGNGKLGVMQWESRGDPERPIDNPGHLTIDPDGNLWVTDPQNNGFQILTPDGELLRRWGSEGSGPGQFRLHGRHSTVGAAAFDPAGNLYVADTGNSRVQKFGPDLSFMLAWGEKGSGDGQFLQPDNLTIDSKGRIYVLDGGRDDIQVFDADGEYVRTIGRYGTGEGQFLFFDTGGLAIDPDGNLWVADISNQRIQKFSPEGVFLAALGRFGFTEGQFSSPNGIAIDRAGNVFVVDVATSGTRVQAFSAGGAYLAGWNEPGGRKADLSTSTSLALDGKGHVYVADYDDDRILKLRLLPPFGQGEPAPVE